MVLNAAVQMLRETEELKEKILKFKSGTSMLQERNIWTLQQQLQKVYQQVLVLDLDYALEKKVEQDLWNIGFKQQIEALQAISKDKKDARRSEGQAMLSWVLQAAAGFYLCLLHQICTAFKLDLPFRRRASLLGWVEGWGATTGLDEESNGNHVPPPAAARYICQHCLVHLGDLARYRQQLRVAHTFYRHALLVSAHSGQPYNQLALVAWRRGRKLGALYWHVRSLLVRAPFPPAPANLSRTLAAAAAAQQTQGSIDIDKNLPVLPGVTKYIPTVVPVRTANRLDAHTYVGELIRTYHMIHTLENLDAASEIVKKLNSSLTALIATDSFESMTLIKMATVTMWLVHWVTEEMVLDESELSEGEATAAQLAGSLSAGAVVALLLPSYTLPAPPKRALPTLKVLLEWIKIHPKLLHTAAFISRPQLWPALAHTLNALADVTQGFQSQLYDTLPLPEDEELHGFLPLEPAFTKLKFSNYATWDTYGDRIPDFHMRKESEDSLPETNNEDDNFARIACDITEETLKSEPELEHKLRSYRLVQLGHWFAKYFSDIGADQFTVSIENDLPVFTATNCGGELASALADLSLEDDKNQVSENDVEEDSDDERQPLPPPPIVISEADFREKVREKRVGILKPQGSLERAREERALATTVQETDQVEIESNTEAIIVRGAPEENRKESSRKTRMNVAMAAILRKQEESSKQVKFVTPATTPDTSVENPELFSVKDTEKPKIIQPKAIKSLANLPLGRKTGGILSLKDKSAGYPHLVNADLEPNKTKTEKIEDKKHENTNKINPNLTENSQQSIYGVNQLLRTRKEQQPPSPSWIPASPGMVSVPNMPFNENLRMNFPQQKTNYNLQTNFSPVYPAPGNIGGVSQGLRLPVVNPKEIDVRSAAVQKQHSRQELFQDARYGHQNWQISGDKKNFLNDLPPRFANQMRYWQQPPNNQFNIIQDSNRREDEFGTNMMFGASNLQQTNTSWPMKSPNQTQDNYLPQSYNWWKPESVPQNYSTNFSVPSMNIQPNYYPQPMSNISNQYQNLSPYNQGPMQPKPGESVLNTNNSYLQPNMNTATIQNLASSQNFGSSLNSFGTYGQNVGYDSSMYPQFNSKIGYQPPHLKLPIDKQVGAFSHLNKDGIGELDSTMRIDGNNMAQLAPSSGLNMNMNVDNLNQLGVSETTSTPEASGMYTLFSGVQEPPAWGTLQQPRQSLWTGSGPSPLERLLEQQKQLRQNPGETQ